MALTLRQAKDRILKRLSMAPGVDTSVYSEEPLNEMIQHKFDILFDEFWWPQFYNAGMIVPLDGDGVPSIDLSPYIKRYMDIRYVWLGDGTLPIPRISTRVNLANIKMVGISGYPDPTKIFQVRGERGSATTATVSFRSKPDAFDDDTDVIDMDDHLIILGTAYDYISDLGINPSQEDKLLTLFNQRYKNITDQMYGTAEINMDDSANPNIPYNWQELE